MLILKSIKNSQGNFIILYTRGPQPPGHGPVVVHGLLGAEWSQQEVRGGQASEASSAAPHLFPSLALPPRSSPAPSPAM